MSSQSHPYYPADLKLPHYVPNNRGVIENLGIFFGIVLTVCTFVWFYSGSTCRPVLSFGRRLTLCWFAACSIIHFVLEGYFVVRHTMIAAEQNLLAQIWKEYGKGDSRYISSDNFMVCMEGITAVIDGPLAVASLIAFLQHRSYRYPLQLILSICQLYGVSLYFLMEIRENFEHSEKGNFLHFWVYFFTLNVIWIIVPTILTIDAIVNIAVAQSALDKTSTKLNRSKSDIVTKKSH